jgi:hypothetical protein
VLVEQQEHQWLLVQVVIQVQPQAQEVEEVLALVLPQVEVVVAVEGVAEVLALLMEA